MNKKTIEVNEDDLHAYVDKQLSAEKIAAVEALMRENPDVLLQVQQWQQLNKAMTKQFDNQRFDDIPAQLNVREMATKLANKKTQGQRWYYAIAASFLMVISASFGWFANELSQPNQQNSTNFVKSAISAYQVFSVEVLHPVEVGADKQEHLVAWLSKRINHPLKLPELQDYGYTLLGGRLLSMQTGNPAAQFMFEDHEGKRITWLVSKNASYHDRAFLSKNDDKVNSFYWMDSNVAYSVTGEIAQKTLREISLEIYQQINDRPLNKLAGL